MVPFDILGLDGIVGFNCWTSEPAHDLTRIREEWRAYVGGYPTRLLTSVSGPAIPFKISPLVVALNVCTLYMRVQESAFLYSGLIPGGGCFGGIIAADVNRFSKVCVCQAGWYLRIKDANIVFPCFDIQCD